MAPNFWILALYGASTLFAGAEAAAFRLPTRRGPIEDAETKWGSVWTAAPQLVEPKNRPPAPFGSETDNLVDTTLRQTIEITLPADQIRLELTNAFGTEDLTIDAVTVALPTTEMAGGSEIQADTVQALTFNNGTASVTIPKGEAILSDAIDFKVETQQVIAVSLYSETGVTTGAITGHPGSRTNSWLAFGDQTAEGNLTGSELINTAHWYFISAVEAQIPSDSKVLGIVGDSITDGRGSDDDKNNRWPNLLFTTLQESPETSNIAVANQGIGGNCVLSFCLGPSVVDRIDRDIFSLPSLGYVMIFEGVNDIGSATSVSVADDLIAAYQKIITQSREANIPIFGATITPILGSQYGTDVGEEARNIVNEWIRNSVNGTGVGFDAIADFDKILEDPSNPGKLKPEYDSGDFLHPSVAGYQAIADQFPVEIFA
ncbi:hypothetical protein FQN54_004666 [Arachnomyces sp. PD_36]|nr:hypothetical protein FQN54_004666 [Arachnomyces sp. PD_36]